MKRTLDNRGVTLLELIIAFALLGILSLGVVGLVSTGAGSFRQVNSEVSLQYESQLAVNQLEEAILDCNGGIRFAGDTLYIALIDTTTEPDTCTVRAFRLDSATRELFYAEAPVIRTLDTVSLALPAADAEGWYLMSEYIDSFSVSVGGSAARINVTMSLSGRSYSASSTVALRNTVRVSSSIETLEGWLTAVCP